MGELLAGVGEGRAGVEEDVGDVARGGLGGAEEAGKAGGEVALGGVAEGELAAIGLGEAEEPIAEGALEGAIVEDGGEGLFGAERKGGEAEARGEVTDVLGAVEAIADGVDEVFGDFGVDAGEGG